jgi:hypothetical protein
VDLFYEQFVHDMGIKNETLSDKERRNAKHTVLQTLVRLLLQL